MADPTGIIWDDEAPPAADIAWDDEITSGPPRPADFGNVEAGAQQNMRPDIGTLGRWFSGVPSAADAHANEEKAAQYGPEFIQNVGSAVQGAREDYQYPQEYYTPDHATSMSELITGPQPHAKRRVGGAEGLVRGLAADLGEFGTMGEAATPIGFAKRIAGAITGHADPGNEMAEAVRLHPETEQYTGARAELVGELGHNIISNLLPVESLFAGAGKFLLQGEKTAAEAAHEAALIGKLGPEAQGAATANEITAQAVERRPPKQPEEAPLGPVSDATMDQSAPLRAGEAETVRAPESLPEGAAADVPRGTPDAGAGVGAPQPLYHASLSPDIERFDVARSGGQSDTGVMGKAAAYVTGDERLAPYYLGPQKDAGTLYQVEHSLKNPKEFASPQEAIAWQGERGTDSPEAAARVRQKYLDAGHDGAIVRNPDTGKIMEAAIFDPNAARITNRRPIKAPSTPAPEAPLINASREAPRAENVRVDQGPTGVPREVTAGGEVRGGGDLQQAREAEGNAVPEQLRGAGEARGNAEAVPELTGVKKAVVTDERARRGLEEVKHDLFRSDAEGMRRAQEKIDANPNYGRDLTEELVRNPRPISKEETFALMHDRTRIISERRAAYEEAERAMDAGDVEGAAQARARVDRLDEEYSQNDHAATVTGHEWAEGGRARQRMMAPDYSMAALVREAKVKKGGELTPAEIRDVEARAKEVEAREAALDKREAELNAREAKPTSSAGSRRAQKTFDSLADELRSSSRAILCELAERAA